jgi:hypothetical protein
MKVDSHFHAVSDLDEGNAAVHSEFLAVERHCPLLVELAFDCH